MDVAYGLDQLDHSHQPVFVVVGVFDGLHRGHAYLLRHLVDAAAARGARPAVITFDHHPDEILTGNAPPLLCDPDERLARLAAAGVGITVVVHFDQRLRQTTYDAFVDMIARRVPVSGFLMTPDAAFGYQRAGTPAALAELGGTKGFEVVIVPPFLVDGRPVSSTQIRAAIEAGDLGAARDGLGRDHCVVGEAVGAGDATVVRFPLPVALPPVGRYLVRAGSALGGHADRVPRTPGAMEPGLPGVAEDAGDWPAGAPVHATVEAGAVKLPGPPVDRMLRIAFLERARPAGQ